MHAHKYVIKLNKREREHYILFQVSMKITISVSSFKYNRYLSPSAVDFQNSTIAIGATRFRDPSSRERKRFGEIENRDSRGSVGQGCSESLRVIRLFPSRSSVAPTTTERTTRRRRTEKRITTKEEQRNEREGRRDGRHLFRCCNTFTDYVAALRNRNCASRG